MSKPRRRFEVSYLYKGETVEFVPRLASEVLPELYRIYEAVLNASRTLATMRRVRHWAVQSARFQLANAIRAPLSSFTPETGAAEIARLSCVLQDTLEILSTLCNSRTTNLEQTRFILTYGQTPRKREQVMKKGAQSYVEEEDDSGDESAD